MKYLKFLIVVLFFTQSALTQIKTLDRAYVPAVQKTTTAPLWNLTINEWTAFRYDAATDTWTAIPFQFDQMNENGDRIDRDASGITDISDEVIFLPTDAGDQANATDWLDDENSKQSERIEIEVTDPLDPSKKAWVYLYKNIATDANVPGYLSYTAGPSETPAADTVATSAFTLGHNQEGWIDYLKFANGNQDIIDRFKLRIKGDGILTPAYEINEDYVEASTADDAVIFTNGPVRAFHTIKADILLKKLGMPLLPDKAAFAYDFEYTPYAFGIYAEAKDLKADLLSVFGVQIIRQSLDFNSNADGMIFYSEFNGEGVLIDGEVTEYDEQVKQDSPQNWVMATGDLGTVFVIFETSLMKNSKRILHFRDNKSNPYTLDGTEDTGDMHSYGDMGIMIEATGSALIPEYLSINYKGYFIDQPNAGYEFGKRLLAWEQNPLELEARLQTFNPSFVSRDNFLAPQSFSLHSAYPNPYSKTSAQGIQFEFSGIRNESYDLIVYNMIGQQVARFTNLSVDANGQHVLRWDARDARGSALAPGVYFYQLDNGVYTQTQKLMISR